MVNTAVHRLVTGNFLGTDGVGAVPLHEHLQRPVRERLVTVVGIVQLVAAGPCAHHALVAGDHIEIDAGEVAFILVIGFKHGSGVAIVGALAQLAEHGNAQFLVDIGLAAGTNSVGIVAAALVHKTIDRDNHHQVGEHGSNLAAKPTLGERMFAVDAFANIGCSCHMGRGVVILAGGVHIDVVAIAARVGIGVTVPKGIVTQFAVHADDTFESGH